MKLAGVVDVGRLPNGRIVDIFCTPAPNINGCDAVEVEKANVGLNVVEAVVVAVDVLFIEPNMISKFCRNCNYSCE